MLLRSAQFPGIAQHDVQQLIWGIEDGVKWDAYDPAFRQRVAPLLANNELALLNLEPMRAEVADRVKQGIGGLIPGALRRAVDTYAELRQKIATATNFDELERIAVKTGVAPWGKDSRKDVQPGPWAYVGGGFFIRAFPNSYPTTTLEVFHVATAKVERDAQGRITRFDSDGYIIETTYQDQPAAESIGGKDVPVWRFRSVTFRHPDGRTYTVENRGYVVARAESRDVPGGGVALDGDLGDMKHYNDGLKVAVNPTDLKGKLKWTVEHLNRSSATWNQASNALGGEEAPGPEPKRFDPTRHTATPANTSKQRLALSGFKKGSSGE